jgi:hypothetical protein
VWAPIAFGQQSTVQPIPDARLAIWILDGTQSVKEGAVSHVLSIPAERRSAVLQDALIKELARLNAARFDRLARASAGQEVEPEDQEGSERYGEYRGQVTQAVAQLTNPAAIPALIGALGSGPLVSRALARFGAASVEPVAKAALADHPDPSATADALRALEGVVSSSIVLSSPDRDRVLLAALERLTGVQHFVVVAAACDLAVATGDGALRNRVQQLANDTAQVTGMGITRPSAVSFVRRVAAEALARKR